MLYERGVLGVDVSTHRDLSGPRDRLWQHAEDFLEKLDRACDKDTSTDFVRIMDLIERRLQKPRAG